MKKVNKTKMIFKHFAKQIMVYKFC